MTDTVVQSDARPTRKMQFAGLWGGLGAVVLAPFLAGVTGLDELIIWAWGGVSDYPMPRSVAGAIVGGLAAAGAAFAGGYVAKDRAPTVEDLLPQISRLAGQVSASPVTDSALVHHAAQTLQAEAIRAVAADPPG